MNGLQRAVGYAWAAPLTLCGLVYVAALSSLGWCQWKQRCEGALVWKLSPHAPTPMVKRWHLHPSVTLGNVVVVSEGHDNASVLAHACEHVAQSMRLGILYPVVYWVAWLALCTCAHAHPSWDNPLEIDARRASGQVIDVIGAVKKAVAEGRLRVPKKA